MTEAHFGDRYQLLDPIAEGGMGTVWRARHVGLDATVALKILSRIRARDPEMKRRFLREARLAARARHPNVVQVHDVGETDGRPYVAMELVEGQPINEWLNWQQPEVSEFLTVVLQALAGLEAVHDAQIIHQDVKPENILVAHNTTGVIAKLIDFGISRDPEEDSISKSGGILGTLRFMAPERLTGGSPDPRSDVYAMGLVLYEGLTGNVPFGDASVGELVQRIQSGVMLRIPGWVPDSLAETIRKATAVDRERRFPTAHAMGKTLMHAQRELDPAVRTRRLRDALESSRGSLSPLVFSSVPPSRRRRLWLVTALGIALGIVTGTAIWYADPPEPPTAAEAR